MKSRECLVLIVLWAGAALATRGHMETPWEYTCPTRILPSLEHREILTANATLSTQAALAARGCCILETIRAPARRDRTQHHLFQSWCCHMDALPLSAPSRNGTPKRTTLSSVSVAHEEVNVFTTQAVGWNLDRIDTRPAIYDNRYTPFGLRTSPPPSGPQIHVFVVDTGIDPTHPAFQNLQVSLDYPSPTEALDCNGHGTHVASIVAGTSTGVFPERGYMVLHGIRVLDCSGSGTTTTVIRGLASITENLPADPTALIIINLSIGGKKSALLNDYLNTMHTEFGIIIVAAAGNENTDACTRSPASAEYTIAVGSTRIGDFRSSFSNYGTCVNMFAPGSEVTGADIDPTRSYRPRSGTSMAAPHITGGIVRFAVELATNAATVTQSSSQPLRKSSDPVRMLSPGETLAIRAWQLMLERSTSGSVRDPGPGSHNRFMFLGDPSTITPPPITPPITPPPPPPHTDGEQNSDPSPPPPVFSDAADPTSPIPEVVYHMIFVALLWHI